MELHAHTSTHTCREVKRGQKWRRRKKSWRGERESGSEEEKRRDLIGGRGEGIVGFS